MMTEVKIQIPNGYELKQVSEGKWELVKSDITLDDILVKNRQYKKSYICTASDTFVMSYKDDSFLERLEALSKLMCVADYLNNGWQPDWNDNEEKWHIECYEYGVNKLRVDLSCTHSTCGEVVFKTQELVEKAIEMCGVELIKKALGV